MEEKVAEQESYTYIPLSSFVILLVILLTCASRRKKVDVFSAVEQSFENDIKGDYAIMCFPCLKKKPEMKDINPTTDLSDQFEYIVEKYTIRKVPLLLANTAEDIIERQEELEMTEATQSQPHLLKDDFVNFQLAQEVYNVHRIPQCITVGANTHYHERKNMKERPTKPSDILESMSPIPRPTIKNPNYVVIPTRGSLRNKDIMLTKREITNQYLNNFSSVFVDNLKDQVPKDPEQFPSLSRPYTSAFKNLPCAETFLKTPCKKGKRKKGHKVAYAFPVEDEITKEESSAREEPFYDSDSGSKEQTTDVPDSDFPEDTADLTDKSKSLVLLNESHSMKDVLECAPNPFKTTIKTSDFQMGCDPMHRFADYEYHSNSIPIQKEEKQNTKNITYEDIQALDVGYEFTSCEKLGVKPKMTRIHYPHESDRGKDSCRQTPIGDSKISKKSFCIFDQPSNISTSKSSRAYIKNKPHQRMPEINLFSSPLVPTKEKISSKSVLTETCFLPKTEVLAEEDHRPNTLETPLSRDLLSTTTFTSKSEGSKTQFLNDIDLRDCEGTGLNDSIPEISKLYHITAPETQCTTELSNYETEISKPDDQGPRFPSPAKSHSFQDTNRTGSRKENSADHKGKTYSTYPDSCEDKKNFSRLDEPEPETSCSVYSRDSKTSSGMTSPKSSEQDEGKRATLRWKIVIKHHRDEDPSRKNLIRNVKH